jgi:hypothetical protein
VIVDDVKALWAHIQTTSWAAVFRAHGVRPEVEKWHEANLRVDRRQPGFEDFAADARRAIEPGDPAHSLIYHALASPRVRPAAEDWFPSLDDLDLIENYIYSLRPLTPSQIQDLVPAVFAYEYRVKGKSTHGRHADLVFSRTGVARVGSRPLLWDAPNRCFTNRNGPAAAFAVTPARYGVFLARRVQGHEENMSLMGVREGDDRERWYLLPVHKLFDGPECIDGSNLTVEFRETHVSEKLQRLVTLGKLELAPGLDAQRPPFVRVSGSAPGEPVDADNHLVDLARKGSSIIVSSPPKELVRLGRQRRPSGSDMIACFKVPREARLIPDLRKNRRYTSLLMIPDRTAALLEIIATRITGHQRKVRPRNVPEFVNIRHRVKNPDAPDDPRSIEILGDVIADRETLLGEVEKGGYLAAFYEDSICEGAVGARIAGLGRATAQPAYSVVTAPDFFPLADAMDLEEWVWTHAGDDGASQFKEGGPEPLCFGRFPVNPGIRSPYGDGIAAFDRKDQTMVAIVGRPMRDARGFIESGRRERTSYLTDAASNEFAPGWDVSFANDGDGHFYATYGLGSPFPEDTKLCAAANAYWPAASPDASRTFARTDTPTAIPLLDDELGYHPRHPKVLNGDVAASLGWDGECGPFLMPPVDGQRFVNHADIMRSDYVSNVLKGHFDRSKLAHIDSEEMIRRMDVLRFCIQVLPTDGNIFTSDGKVSSTKLWLVSAENLVFDDSAALPKRVRKSGKGYKFAFVRLPDGVDDDEAVVDPVSPGRLLQAFDGPVYTCLICRTGLCWQRDEGRFEFIEAPPDFVLS